MNSRLFRILLNALAALALSVALSARAGTNQFERLTLEQAQEMAERHQPQLAEARARVEAATGRAQQAGTFPNPEAIVGAQQLPLQSGASNQREFVAGIAQPIPLGNRLAKAREVELLDREVRERGLEATRRDLHKRVHSTFATALYQTRAFETQSQITQSLEKSAAIAEARVATGDAVAEGWARVEMELARARTEVRRSGALREQALAGLAAAIGDASLKIGSLSGSLETAFEIPTLESLAAAVSAQPEIQMAQTLHRAELARVALAGAERIPDVKVEVLYHRLEAAKENTLDIGLSVPLPLFDRSRGRLREARAEAAAAQARVRMTENELNLRLREAHSQLTAALANARAYRMEILPRAETLLKAAEARHAAGDTSLAEVLPARRDRAAAQLAHLESLRDVMQAWAELSAHRPR